MADAIVIFAIEEHGVIRVGKKTALAELQCKYAAPDEDELGGG
jgi:hypothetical protein